MKNRIRTIGALLVATLIAAGSYAELIIYEPFDYPEGAAKDNDASHGYNVTTTGGLNGIPFHLFAINPATTNLLPCDPTNYYSWAGTYEGNWSSNSPGTGLRGTWRGSNVSPGLTFTQANKVLVTKGLANKHVAPIQWHDGPWVYRSTGPDNPFGLSPDDEMIFDGWTNYRCWTLNYHQYSTRPFGAPGTVLYFSFLMQVNDLTQRAWICWKAGTWQNLYIGINPAQGTNKWTVFYDNQGGPAIAQGAVPATTNVTLFVGRWSFIGGEFDTNNLFEVWVNPTLGQPLPSTPDLYVTGVTNIHSTLFQFSTRINADGSGADNLTIDEIRVGTTLEDVTPYTELPPPTPPTITVTRTGNTVTLDWGVTGWTLQAQTNSLSSGISTNWVDIPGTPSVSSINMPIMPDSGAVFFRLKY